MAAGLRKAITQTVRTANIATENATMPIRWLLRFFNTIAFFCKFSPPIRQIQAYRINNIIILCVVAKNKGSGVTGAFTKRRARQTANPLRFLPEGVTDEITSGQP